MREAAAVGGTRAEMTAVRTEVPRRRNQRRVLRNLPRKRGPLLSSSRRNE